jgi:hypothetical protein
MSKETTQHVQDISGDQTAVDSAVIRGVLSRGVPARRKLTELRVNPENPRKEMKTEEIVSSYRRQGYDPTCPILIDESGMILRGHRRFLAAADFIKAVDAATAESVFPAGEVPVIVCPAVTRTEMLALLVDQGKSGDRKPLTAWEYVSAVGLFVAEGVATQAFIGDHFGFGRSWAQKMVALCKLPETVRAKFEPALSGRLTETKLRSNDILTVSRDYHNSTAEQFAGLWAQWENGTHPEGEAYKAEQDAAKGRKQMLDYSAFRDNRNVGCPATLTAFLEANPTAAGFAASLKTAFKDAEFLAAVIAALPEKTRVKAEETARNAKA